ncbi:MAG: Holliday junction resolvase RuvX [Chitinispirillaceae bacterium]|nr:Holliday junction resolvase RuvX [Chitinispirillaceae bacterium]
MKLISIDYGRRRIGIAIGGDPDTPVRGLPTIDRKKHSAITSLTAIIEREKPTGLLFGLPLDSNDAETVMSKEVRTFARELQELTGLPVYFIDESRSSLQAGELLLFRKKKERRDKGSVDRLAACLILDQYLRENGCS